MSDYYKELCIELIKRINDERILQSVYFILSKIKGRD